MIDFELSLGNMVRQDSTKCMLKGAEVKVEYRLHKDDVRDPDDPEGNPLTLFCVHLPQINMTYVDETEELAFEAMNQFFEEDFIRFFAERLVEEREKREQGDQ